MSNLSNSDYIVKVSLKAQVMKSLFNIISNHTNEININFSPNEIVIFFYEELTFSFKINLNNNDNGFTDFYIEDNIKIGINVKHFMSLLKSISPSCNITIFVKKAKNKKDQEKFGLLVEDIEYKKITTMEIKPIDVNEEIQEFDRNFSCKISMSSIVFQSDITLVKSNDSEFVRIIYNNGIITYHTESDIAVVDTTSQCLSDNTNNDGPIILNVRVSKLNDVSSKLSTLSNRVLLYLQNNASMLIVEYSISNIGIIRFGIPTDNNDD